LAWGYSPKQVVKHRAASFDKSASKGPGYLLIVVALLAGIVVFGIVSEILGTPGAQGTESLMIQLNGGEKEEADLLIDAQTEWATTEDSIDRGYRVLWKKPAEIEQPGEDALLWEKDRARKVEEEGRKGPDSWDEVPDNSGL
jgi:hypothetical protein